MPRAISGGLDKRLVRRAFSRAAGAYDELAELQRAVAHRLLDQVAANAATAGSVLDVGAGTGYCLSRIARLRSGPRLIALDLSEGMLRQIRRSNGPAASALLIAGDAECLPIRGGSVDLVISNLALQWCGDPAAVFRELARVLKPGGRIFFSSFGEGTLRELRDAWSAVDDHSHVNDFRTGGDLARAITACGLELLFLKPDLHVAEYRDVTALMRELKGLGAHNVTADRPRHLLGKGALAKMISVYAARHGTTTGGITASFEILLGAAGRSV